MTGSVDRNDKNALPLPSVGDTTKSKKSVGRNRGTSIMVIVFVVGRLRTGWKGGKRAAKTKEGKKNSKERYTYVLESGRVRVRTVYIYIYS